MKDARNRKNLFRNIGFLIQKSPIGAEVQLSRKYSLTFDPRPIAVTLQYAKLDDAFWGSDDQFLSNGECWPDPNKEREKKDDGGKSALSLVCELFSLSVTEDSHVPVLFPA